MVFRFRFAALVLCTKCLLALTSIGVLIYSLVFSDFELTVVGLGLGGLAIFSTIVQWIISARTKCPLCLTPVLAHKSCSKHRRARRFLGSHRLRVALAVIFRGSFVCPYCNEPTAVEVRTKRQGYSRG